LPNAFHYFGDAQNISIGDGWRRIVFDAAIEASNEFTEPGEKVKITPDESPDVVDSRSSELQ